MPLSAGQDQSPCSDKFYNTNALVLSALNQLKFLRKTLSYQFAKDLNLCNIGLTAFVNFLSTGK